jgi:hypothetical protein
VLPLLSCCSTFFLFSTRLLDFIPSLLSSPEQDTLVGLEPNKGVFRDDKDSNFKALMEVSRMMYVMYVM